MSTLTLNFWVVNESPYSLGLQSSEGNIQAPNELPPGTTRFTTTGDWSAISGTLTYALVDESKQTTYTLTMQAYVQALGPNTYSGDLSPHDGNYEFGFEGEQGLDVSYSAWIWPVYLGPAEIVYAGYGVWGYTRDATSPVVQAYSQGTRKFLANNSWVGDPKPGARKYLYILWKTSGGELQSGVVGEDDSRGITLP